MLLLMGSGPIKFSSVCEWTITNILYQTLIWQLSAIYPAGQQMEVYSCHYREGFPGASAPLPQ